MAYGVGVTAADYDNDGHPDLYVSNFGPKVLYRNNGDGTFTDVTGEAGVADGSKARAGACFLDADGDGNLDLYVANYVKFSCDRNVVTPRGGFLEYTSPRSYPRKTTRYCGATATERSPTSARRPGSPGTPAMAWAWCAPTTTTTATPTSSSSTT